MPEKESKSVQSLEAAAIALADTAAQGCQRLGTISDELELYRTLGDIARHELQLERVAIFQRRGEGFTAVVQSDARGRLKEEGGQPLPPDYEEKVLKHVGQSNPPLWWMEVLERYAWENGAYRSLGSGWVSFTLIHGAGGRLRAVVVCDGAVSNARFDPVRLCVLAALCAFAASHLGRLELIAGLAQEHAQLLAILEGLDLVAYVSDPETYEVLYCNPYLRRLFGSDPVGKICYREFQHRESPCDFCTNDWLRAHPGQTLRWEYYNPVLKRDYLIFDRLIRWPDGRDVRFELAIDITEQKKAERERYLRYGYERALLSRAETLAQVAHELRSPLNALLGTVQGSLRGIYGQLTEMQRRAFDRIYESGRYLAELVDDLLARGREFRGEMTLRRSRVPVSVLLRSVLSLVEPELAARRLQLVFRLDEDTEDLEVNADQRLLQEVLVNLITNSCRYSPPREKIVVAARRLDRPALAGVESHLGSPASRWLEISVIDRGRGLSEAECEMIFHGLRKDGEQRTLPPIHLGVGLPLCRRIAVMHGGWLWAESPGLNRGCTFRLVLPLDEGEEDEAEKGG